MSEDRERFESTYAEIVYRLALYSNYLRRQGHPHKAIGKGIQDRIRALLEERSNDASED